MKFNIKQIQLLKNIPNNTIYEPLKIEFLFHSNKLEGSTFSKENLQEYLDKEIITGSHKVDDIYETINSTKLFDFIIDTLGEPITKRLLKEFHSILKNNTKDKEYSFVGEFKKIPNMLSGIDLKLAQPYEVEPKLDKLIDNWNNSKKDIEKIAYFHYNFELIHPFQDGNGRIGRFLILKQCIENEVDLIAIDSKLNKQYKNALYIAQTSGNDKELVEIFKKSQERLDYKFQNVDIESIKKNLNNLSNTESNSEDEEDEEQR